MEQVIAYIDGFNLYYGTKTAFGRKYLWLDLEALCRSILRPHQNLRGVKYFSARVRSPKDSQERQNVYIDALRNATIVEPIFGRMQLNEFTCRQCQAIHRKPEEKKTDVAIASHLVADAYEGSFDMALLITGDSDMCPPVEMVSKLTGRRVIAAFPPRRKSAELRSLAAGSISISEAALRQSQLPESITLDNGTVLRRPARWV